MSWDIAEVEHMAASAAPPVLPVHDLVQRRLAFGCRPMGSASTVFAILCTPQRYSFSDRPDAGHDPISTPSSVQCAVKSRALELGGAVRMLCVWDHLGGLEPVAGYENRTSGLLEVGREGSWPAVNKPPSSAPAKLHEKKG